MVDRCSGEDVYTWCCAGEAASAGWEGLWAALIFGTTEIYG